MPTIFLPKCGLIMPIGSGDGYSNHHWKKWCNMLESIIADCGFKANLVSSDSIITPIHRNIVQNIFDYPIVICDVSSRNPNVLFELGLRFAFGKPAILIKDNTNDNFIFDINLIHQIRYPRRLVGKGLEIFCTELKSALHNTYHHFNSNPSDSQFLKLFNIPNPTFTSQIAEHDRQKILDRVAFFQTAINLLEGARSFRSTFLGPLFLHPQWLVNRRNKLVRNANFDSCLLSYIKRNSRKYPGQIRLILRNTKRYTDKLDQLIKENERPKFIKDIHVAIDDFFGPNGNRGSVDLCCYNPGHYKIDMIFDDHYLEGSRKSEQNQITSGFLYSGIDQVNQVKKDFDSMFDNNFTSKKQEVEKLKEFVDKLWK